MFKLIKFLIKLCLFLILIAAIGVGVVVFLAYDDTKIPYDAKPEVSNFETNVARDLHDSLDEIAATNYQNNNIAISLTVDEVNAIIVDMIRSKKPEYLVDGNTSIVEFAGTSFDGVFFDIVDNDLSGKAYFTVIDFYKTNIALEVNAEIYADNKLIVTFQDLKIGKGIKLSRPLVQKVVSLFADYIPDVELVDIKNLSITLELQNYLKELTNNPLLDDLISSGQYSLEVSDDNLLVKMDTQKIITGEVEIKNGTTIDVAEIINSFEYTSGFNGSVTISEANFNYLIKEEFEEDLQDFETTINICGSDFTFGLNEFYFDVNALTVYTNLSINNCITKASLKVELSKVMNSQNELESIDLTVTEVWIGDTLFANVDTMLSNVSIPASRLSFEILTLTDFEIIAETSQIKLTGKIDLI